MARYIGDYEVLSELGAGHYGTVYRAAGMTPARGRNPAKRRLVAIKKLKDTAGAGSVDLLLQEFALLDQVKHRGIVRVFEYLEDEHAVVMEHIHGVTLRRVLEELDTAHEQVFTEAAVEIGCELADALYQAYTTPGDNGEPLQLVHRDLKPANVMLTPQGEVKILDFGLARVDNADFARDDRSRVKGTPIYMAPEQARGLEVDHRTDLFALGLILYELLMGEAAYRIPKSSSDPVADVFAAIEAGDLGSQCRELETTLPAHGPIVTRLLQRRPEDRYQNGHDALVDLRRQLYRDRGSYLTEFCEFFFGTICDIGPAPQLGSVSSGAARSPGRGRRLSIEERLRQSMAREDKARSTAQGDSLRKTSRSASGRGADPSNSHRNSPPRPGQAPAASRVRPPALPPAVPSAGRSGRSDRSRLAPPPPPPSSGVSMSTNRSGGSGRRPARPPVGGSASRAKPFTPAGGSRGPLKAVGQRSPDETGMLEMVPLSADSDRSEAGADPSATAFFAIPAPKADRSRPAGGGPPSGPPPGGGLGHSPSGPPPAPGGGFGGPPPPPGGGFAPPPPGGAMARPGNLAPPTPQPIQGPVAGYGGPQAGGATPFVVAGPTPGTAPSADADSRVQSTRLYAILFACFVLVSVAIVVAVWLRPGGSSGGDAVADNTSTAPNTAVVDGIRKKAEPKDTGVVEAAPAPTPRRHTRSTVKTTAAPAPAPPSNPGAITVKLGDPNGFSSMTVLCPSGFRAKGTFSGGSATVGGVPAGQSCSLIFNGGISPGRFSGAQSGKTFTCSMIGSGMVCR